MTDTSEGAFTSRELLGRSAAMSSVTRIWEATGPLSVEAVPRAGWTTGDYVLAEVMEHRTGRGFELRNGRFLEPAEGDLFVGALGSRFATLEATGSWEDVTDDGLMHVLTGGGVLGKCRSRSTLTPPLLPVRYQRFDCRMGRPATGGRASAVVEVLRPPEGDQLH